MLPSSFHSLPPELHQQIVATLAPCDLAQCMLVGRNWSAVCTPELWKSIIITTRKAYLRFQSPEAQAALARNAHHVRELKTIYFTVIENIFRPLSITNTSSFLKSAGSPVDENSIGCICTGLVRLDLDKLWRTPFPIGHSGEFKSMIYGSGSYFPNLAPEQEHLILQIIQSNPRLRVLIIGGYIKHRAEILSFISDTTLPHLQELRLFFSQKKVDRISPGLATVKQFMENCPQSLRKLEVDLAIVNEHGGDPIFIDGIALYPSSFTSCLPHKSMESLFVSGLLVPIQCLAYVLLPFLQSCDKETLKSVFAPSHSIDPMYSALTDLNIAPRKNLDLEYEYNTSEQQTVEMLAAEQTWTRVRLRGFGDYSTLPSSGSHLAEVLLERCEHLEALEIHTCVKEFSSKQLQQLLCRSPRLTFLGANCRQTAVTARNPILDARDAIQAPWVCTRIKTLKIEIGGIPRPDITVGHDGSTDIKVGLGGSFVKGELFGGTVEESHQIQRQVYQQLARLTDLTTLKLGGELWEPDALTHEWMEDAQGRWRDVDLQFQLNGLEMSLASGLDLLSGLKQLRELDVTRMPHRIGVPELEWMQRNWPNLERLTGLFDPWYKILEPGVREWLIEADPIWGSEYFSSYFTFNMSGTCGSADVDCDQDD